MSRLEHILDRLDQIDETICDPHGKLDAEYDRLVAEMRRILRTGES